MLPTLAQAAAAAVVLARLAPRPPPPAAARPRAATAAARQRRRSRRATRRRGSAPCLAGLAGDPDVARGHRGRRPLARRDRGRGAARTGRAWSTGPRAAARLGRQAVGAAAGPRGGDGRRRRLARRRHAPAAGPAPARSPGRSGTPTSSPPARASSATRPGERLLHPSMLASLVYRYGPGGRRGAGAPARVLANGQCTAVRRARAAGGGRLRARRPGHMTDDAALARALARAGLADRVPRRRRRCSRSRMHDSARGDVARVGPLDRAAPT